MAGEFVGLKEANAALRKLPEIARDDVQKVNDVTAFHVAREASIKAPRASGLLAASIRWESRPRSLSAVVGVAAAAFYWKFVEYGTRKMSARPFLRPSADRNRSDHRARLVDALSRAAAKIARLAR